MYLIYIHEPEGAKRPRASDCKSDTSRLGVMFPIGYYGFASYAYCSTVAMESRW